MEAQLDENLLNEVLVKYGSMPFEDAVKTTTLELIEKEYIGHISAFVDFVKTTHDSQTWKDQEKFEDFIDDLENIQICLVHLRSFMSEHIKINQDVNIRLITHITPMFVSICEAVTDLNIDSVRHITLSGRPERQVDYSSATDLLIEVCMAASELLQYIISTRISDVYTGKETTGQSKEDLAKNLFVLEKCCLEVCIRFCKKIEALLDIICFNTNSVSDDFHEYLNTFSYVFSVIISILSLFKIRLEQGYKTWNKLKGTYSVFINTFLGIQTRIVLLVRQMRKHIVDIDGDTNSPKYTRGNLQFGMDLQTKIDTLKKSKVIKISDIETVECICKMFVGRIRDANSWTQAFVLADNLSIPLKTKPQADTLAFCHFKALTSKPLTKLLPSIPGISKDERFLWCFHVDINNNALNSKTPLLFEVPTNLPYDPEKVHVYLRVRSRGKWTKMSSAEKSIKVKENCIEFGIREADCLIATYDFPGDTCKITRSGICYKSKIDPRCNLKIPEDAVTKDEMIDVKFIPVDSDRLLNYTDHRPNIFENLLGITDGVKVNRKTQSEFCKPVTLRFPYPPDVPTNENLQITVISVKDDSVDKLFSIDGVEVQTDECFEVKVSSFSTIHACVHRRRTEASSSSDLSQDTKPRSTLMAQTPVLTAEQSNADQDRAITGSEVGEQTPDDVSFKAAQVACGAMSLCKILTFYNIDCGVLNIWSFCTEIIKAESTKHFITSNNDMRMFEKAGTSRDIEVTEGTHITIEIAGNLQQYTGQTSEVLQFPFKREMDCHTEFAVQGTGQQSNVGFVNYIVNGNTQHSITFVLKGDGPNFTIERQLAEGTERGERKALLSKIIFKLSDDEKQKFIYYLSDMCCQTTDVSDFWAFFGHLLDYTSKLKRDRKGPVLMKCLLEMKREDLVEDILIGMINGEDI